jgi:hypothetical protein
MERGVMPDVGPDACDGCGLLVAGGTAGCQSVFEELGARDYLDVRFGRHHRVVVDVYSLQHPDRYCASAKSLMAHLTGLCAWIDHPGHPALLRALQQALNGAVVLRKPDLPSDRGFLTIAGVRDAREPGAYEQAVDRWARSTWAAYAPLHALARAFVARHLPAG